MCGRVRVEGAEEAAMGSDTGLQESGHEGERDDGLDGLFCCLHYILSSQRRRWKNGVKARSGAEEMGQEKPRYTLLG